MPRYRSALPQLAGDLFLTDGGLETCLIFHDGYELPHFASFEMLKSAEHRKALKDYFRRYLDIAAANDVGFILDTPTWRASADWTEKMKLGDDAVERLNQDGVALMTELRDEYAGKLPAVVLTGVIGPRGDGYQPGALMTEEAAEAYHARQVAIFAASEVDMVSAATMNNIPEAVGVARAAAKVGLPSAISFTVETDGKLPGGETLEAAIWAVDAATGGAPAYFMINCAHPEHFAHLADERPGWLSRIRGVRANASRMSHAELDEATELDDGDPQELGRLCSELRRTFGSVNILGGCCGTDHRHVDHMCRHGMAA